ncbi:MAG: CocE/NonD family hydrolase [Nitrospirales bacterium]|nr:CocE/NonD family hydrolase [Nitrospira sp.]MDR4500321.1 CocE/NonD family hydrolase [Nitrospirales bacterium]
MSAVVCGHALAATDAAQNSPRPYEGKPLSEECDYTRHSLYLEMSDGVQLAITVYLPDRADNSHYPAILHQTRYWRAIEYRWPVSMFQDDLPRGLMGTYAKRFLQNGYAWIDVDVRGSGASFGSRPYAYSPREILDGKEIVDWIVRQPWSSERVGALGISYAGATAEMLLVNQHPAVKAVAPLFSGFDLYPEIVFPGGIHLTWFTNTWTYIGHQLDHNQLPFRGWFTKAFVHGVMPVDTDHDRSLLTQALSQHAQNWSPHEQALSVTFRDDTPSSKAVPDIDSLSTRHYAKDIANSKAAIYSYSGWLDGGYQLAAINRHLRHSQKHNKLIIGPWDHGGRRNISPFHLSESEFDHQGELLKFFDYHLRGLETGIKDEASVHYFTMGEERWKAHNIWPPEAEPVRYFLSNDSHLSTLRPSENEAYDRYLVNPSVGTGHQTRWDTLIGQPLPTPYADRAYDPSLWLSYTTQPLEQDTEVTGHPHVTMYLSSTTDDATVFAYLEDVDPTKQVTYVTEGQLRALHRQEVDPPEYFPKGLPYRTFTRHNARPLVPGQTVRLSFALLPTSYLFKRGHTIRLTITGTDKDHFALLPGALPTFTIHRSNDKASYLELPIILK